MDRKLRDKSCNMSVRCRCYNIMRYYHDHRHWPVKCRKISVDAIAIGAMRISTTRNMLIVLSREPHGLPMALQQFYRSCPTNALFTDLQTVGIMEYYSQCSIEMFHAESMRHSSWTTSSRLVSWSKESLVLCILISWVGKTSMRSDPQRWSDSSKVIPKL